MTESENQIRLRKAKEAVASCQAGENEARATLASAVESTKRARERYNELFTAEENRERTRRRATYNHATS